MISRESLQEMLATLQKQRDEHFAIYQQAIGAIGVIGHQLKMLDKDHLTTDELGEMVGGKVESIDPI
jgi:hypothetical protein